MGKLQATYACLPATQRGHGVLIGGDPASSTIAYCNGRAVILRSLDDPMQTDVYTEHAHPTTVARFSPNGEWVASADTAGNVRVWARKAEFAHKLKFEIRAISGCIDDLQWSADGQRILVSGDGKGSQRVRCFMWDSGNNVGEFDGHSKRVLSCAVRPIRPFRIASGGEDFLVNFYEGPPFRFAASHREHQNYVNCVRFAPDGSKFVTVGSDRRAVLFEGKTGGRLGELGGDGGHTGSIYAASWSPDGKQLLTVSADKSAKIWDVTAEGSGTLSATFAFAEKPGVEHMQNGCLWLPRHIITVGLNGDINFLSPANPSLPLRTLVGHSKPITAMAVVDGDAGVEYYSSSYDGVIVRWRAGQGPIGRVAGQGHGNSVKAIAVGGTHLVTCGLDDTVRRTRLPAEQYSSEVPTPLGSQPRGFAVAAAAAEVALCATEKGLVVLSGSKVLATMPVSFDATAVGLSPDGTEAVVGAADGKLHVFAVKGDTLTEEAVLERHRAPITTIAYSPDGSMVASGDQKPEIVVWDRATREVKVKNMLYHTARVSCLAWSPDSALLASGSVDTSVIVWDVAKPASSRVTIRHAHPGGVNAVVFKDRTTVASAGDDACIREWALS